jgi:shikimate dehydrogenase
VPVAAVLGWPLAHTLSPVLHQAAYRAAGLDGWTYQARPTRPEELAAALEEVRAGRLAGVNLTTPHKQPAAALVDGLERPADRLGAVNTVFVRDGRLVGGNTDVAGAVWALGSQLGLRDGRWPGTGPAVLLGTGGVALAVAFAWSRLATARRHQGLPAPPLVVAGRDPDRAAAVAALAGPGAEAAAWSDAVDLVAAADVVIQATTLTARGEPVPGQDRLRPGVRVLDCNYGPASQGLVAAARAAGAAAAADGLGMLCAQAAGAVVKIARVRPDLGAMAAAVGFAWPDPPGNLPGGPLDPPGSAPNPI